MRLIKLANLAATVVTLAACGLLPADKSKVRTVHEVLENMIWWNGSVVRVAGYMPSCAGYDCTLFQTEQEEEEFWRVIKARDRKRKTPDFLSVAYDADFDRKAQKFAGRYVIVTGKISTECRSFSGKPLCLDRASDILPSKIEAADL